VSEMSMASLTATTSEVSATAASRLRRIMEGRSGAGLCENAFTPSESAPVAARLTIGWSAYAQDVGRPDARIGRRAVVSATTTRL
jgi:hypothetical protein